VRRLALLACALLALAPVPLAAEDRLPGEAASLTDDVRAKAEKHVAAIVAGKEPEKAARALLVLGPAVWPVIDQSRRVSVADAPKPWFGYLHALLVPKGDPDFEALRARLRRSILSGRPDAIAGDLREFRRGRPDPAQRGKQLPLAVPVQELPGGGKSYRSSDGTILVGFGGDGNAKNPDAGDVSLSDPTPGFVAAMGGRGLPAPDVGGRGGHAVAVAENGYAFAWAQDGADGEKPQGRGGEAGVAEARGGAGSHVRQGKPGKDAAP
jgi:hypothetical protein